MHNEVYLFTDASANPQSKIGFGAALLVENLDLPTREAKDWVELVQFDNTSSTKLEIQVLLHTLAKLEGSNKQVIVYTDSQNIVGLPDRRSRFEKNNYISKNGRLISNHELYKAFYRLTDSLNCEFVKVKGHKPSALKSKLDGFFTLVDRASRNALRSNAL